MKERRRAARHRCRLKAELRRGGQRFEASLLDVSLSGLSLQTGVALSQGEAESGAGWKVVEVAPAS